jgi:hypothetical protein
MTISAETILITTQTCLWMWPKEDVTVMEMMIDTQCTVRNFQYNKPLILMLKRSKSDSHGSHSKMLTEALLGFI